MTLVFIGLLSDCLSAVSAIKEYGGKSFQCRRESRVKVSVSMVEGEKRWATNHNSQLLCVMVEMDHKLRTEPKGISENDSDKRLFNLAYKYQSYTIHVRVTLENHCGPW